MGNLTSECFLDSGGCERGKQGELGEKDHGLIIKVSAPEVATAIEKR